MPHSVQLGNVFSKAVFTSLPNLNASISDKKITSNTSYAKANYVASLTSDLMRLSLKRL